MLFLFSLLLAGPLLAQEPGYDVLVARLGNRDPRIRREAVRMLGELGDRRAIPVLGKAVKDLDEETRLRAVESLGRLLDRESIPFLGEALGDPARRVKETAIHGLVTLYVSREGPGGLVGLFNRAVELFRRGSEDLVAPPGTEVDPRVVEALAFAVTDPEQETARDAARALGILLPSPAHGAGRVPAGAGSAGEARRQAVKAMAEALFHAPREVKMEILRAFQKIRDPQPVPEVARLLNSSEAEVRAQAAYTLGLLGARDQTTALRQLFESDRERAVRLSAFEALSLMPAPDQEEWFAGFLDDKDERMREFAADALGRLATPSGGDDRLRARHAAEKKAGARLALAFALVARGHGEFLGELMDSLDSSFHRQHGQAYLVELGRDASRLPSYYPYLRSEKADVRRYLCEVFGMLANPAALPEVKPLMNDSNNNVVTAAIRAVQVMERFQ